MIRFLSLGLCVAFTSVSAQEFVPPDTTTSVTLSNTDVNRIVCDDGVINNVFFSEEKGMTVATDGNNAFVKYVIKQQDLNNEYVTTSTELHIVCDGKTFTLIGHPAQMNAQTVHLSDGENRVSQLNITHYGPLDYEERITEMMRQVYRHEIDEHFSVEPLNKPVSVVPHDVRKKGLYQNITFFAIRRVTMDGLAVKATEYQITAKQDLNLAETDFLEADLGNNIAAITLSRLNLRAGESARLIIIH